MKNVIILIIILIVLLVLSVQVLGQNSANIPTRITIRHSEVNNGVVIITAQQLTMGKAIRAAIELQCNKDTFACKIPGPGTYRMVRLPKNHGVYECMNVDLYLASADTENSEMIGEYCLIEK